jgi:hypothetical protein
VRDIFAHLSDPVKVLRNKNGLCKFCVTVDGKFGLEITERETRNLWQHKHTVNENGFRT